MSEDMKMEARKLTDAELEKVSGGAETEEGIRLYNNAMITIATCSANYSIKIYLRNYLRRRRVQIESGVMTEEEVRELFLCKGVKIG